MSNDNLMANSNNGFFPVDASREWSYTSEFAIRFPKTGAAAKKIIGNTPILVIYNNAVSKQGRARQALRNLIDIARQAENKYLADHEFTNANPNNWSDLIKGINLILGTKASFEYNLKQLQKLDNNENISKYQDISIKLYDYLAQEAKKVIKANLDAPPASLVQEILQRGINRMRDFTIKDETGQDIQPYYELYNVINIGMNNAFLKSMSEIYKIENFVLEYQQYLTSDRKGKEPTLQVKGNKTLGASSVEELLSQVTMGELAKIRVRNSGEGWNLTVDAQETGHFLYKPDAILFEATYAASFEESAKEIQHNKSKRVSGVQTARQWFQHLEEAKGSLVISSNKNYIINELFKTGGELWNGRHKDAGFSAQSPMSLENFESFANELKISTAKIDYLIDYLANLGDLMILGSTPNDNILKGLATQVGYFLFDDLTVTPPSDLNVVHVFRLSGIYVPLSFVLDCVEKSLDSSLEEMKKSVNIEVLTGDSLPSDWSADEFKRFREEKMKENKIKVHFLSDFAHLIASNVNI